MAASRQPQSDGLPKTTSFRTTDRPDVKEHAEERWNQRVLDKHDGLDLAVDVAWREAEPVPYGTHNATFLRYHVRTDTLLLAQRTHDGTAAVTVLKTVLKAEWREDRAAVRRAVAAIRAEVRDG